MTICKTLARRTDGDREIVAEEEITKHSSVPTYHIIVIEDDIPVSITKTARTTWRKAFKNA